MDLPRLRIERSEIRLPCKAINKNNGYIQCKRKMNVRMFLHPVPPWVGGLDQQRYWVLLQPYKPANHPLWLVQIQTPTVTMLLWQLRAYTLWFLSVHLWVQNLFRTWDQQDHSAAQVWQHIKREPLQSRDADQTTWSDTDHCLNINAST